MVVATSDLPGDDAGAVVRLTGDNPFVDGALVDLVVAGFQAGNPATAYAHNIRGCGFPYGLYVEIVRRDALCRVLAGDDPMDREHVTWNIRRRPGDFPQVAVPAPMAFAATPLTIDTEDDYRRLTPVFAALYDVDPRFSLESLSQADS